MLVSAPVRIGVGRRRGCPHARPGIGVEGERGGRWARPLGTRELRILKALEEGEELHTSFADDLEDGTTRRPPTGRLPGRGGRPYTRVPHAEAARTWEEALVTERRASGAVWRRHSSACTAVSCEQGRDEGPKSRSGYDGMYFSLEKSLHTHLRAAFLLPPAAALPPPSHEIMRSGVLWEYLIVLGD